MKYEKCPICEEKLRNGVCPMCGYDFNRLGRSRILKDGHWDILTIDKKTSQPKYIHDEKAKKDMESMLDYVDKLNELDTSSVEPMSHVFPVKNVFREDVVTNGDGSEDTLKNAPEAQDNAFVVPKTII